MRKLYADRQRIVIEAIRRELSHWIAVRPVGAGMHVVGLLPERADAAAVAKRAATRGITVRPVSHYYHSRAPRPGLLIGHSAVTSGQLRRGMTALAATLAETLGPPPRPGIGPATFANQRARR